MSESNPTPAQPTAPEAAQNPLSYKDKIEEAYSISGSNQLAIIRIADVLDELINKFNSISAVQREIRKQLVAGYKLAEQGKPVTADSVAQYISDAEAEALKKSIAEEVTKGNLQSAEAITGPGDLVVYSNPDVALGSQPFVSFDEELKTALVGKKPGEDVSGLKIEGVYRYPTKKQEGTTDGSEQKTDQEAQQ